MVQGRRRRVDELSAALAARVGAPDRAVSDEGPNSRWMTCVLRGVALASGSLSLYSRDPSRHAPRIRPESTVAARLRRRLDRWPRDTRVFAPASYVGDSQVNSPFATFIGARSLRRALVPGDGSDLRYRGIRAGATARKPRGERCGHVRGPLRDLVPALVGSRSRCAMGCPENQRGTEAVSRMCRRFCGRSGPGKRCAPLCAAG